MNVPILKLKKNLLTTLQSDLTDQQALEFQQDLLRKIRETDAEGVLIDISSLDVIDSFMAKVLNETADMVRLLGTKIVLCGMQPLVALTLVEMGRELIGVETALDLEQGLEKLQEMLAEE